MQHRVSEIFFREQIALSLGLQQLDFFLSRILTTLFQQSNKLPKDKLQKLLLYDPKNAMTPIDSARSRVTGIIQLGNKGINMVQLKNFGYPVPPGFIITTEVFRCREIIDSYPPATENFKDQVALNIANLEKTTGRKFGNPERKLPEVSLYRPAMPGLPGTTTAGFCNAMAWRSDCSAMILMRS